MSARAMDCAAYLVVHANNERHPISNLQLQKMLFFAQIKYMVSHHGNKMFSDDIYAWQYGPVIPRVYGAYSHNGGSPIEHVSPIGQNGQFNEAAFAVRADQEDPSIRETLDSVLDEWINKPAWSLVAAAHEKRKAWDVVYNRNGDGSGNGTIIDVDTIMKTYGSEN